MTASVTITARIPEAAKRKLETASWSAQLSQNQFVIDALELHAERFCWTCPLCGGICATIAPYQADGAEWIVCQGCRRPVRIYRERSEILRPCPDQEKGDE